MVKKDADDLLTAFLYVLQRDRLPVGVVNAILADLEWEAGIVTDGRYVFSDAGLAALARKQAASIRGVR